MYYRTQTFWSDEQEILRGLLVMVSKGFWIVIPVFVGAAGAIGRGIERGRDLLLTPDVGLGLIAVTLVVGGLKVA